MKRNISLTVVSTFLCLLAFFAMHQAVMATSQGITGVPPSVDFTETITLLSTEDGDDVCELEEECKWNLEIWVKNNGPGTITGVNVTEKLGAELQIDDPTPPPIQPPHEVSSGTFFTWEVTGATFKVHMQWEIGTLKVGDTAYLKLQISTDVNPGGHHEYTTCGECYYLNSGATLKYLFEGVQDDDHEPEVKVCIPCDSVPLFSDVLWILPVAIFSGALVVLHRRKK